LSWAGGVEDADRKLDLRMSTWLKKQLKLLEHLDNCPAGELLEHHYDDPQAIVDEAARLAAAAGLPRAVEACSVKIRTVSDARQALAVCLAEIKPEAEADAPMTVAEASERFNLAKRTVYLLCEQGKLPHSKIGKVMRIRVNKGDEGK